MSNYTFEKVANIPEVRQLLELHHSLTGMAYSLFDPSGNNLLTVGWQNSCLRFHRTNPDSCSRCRASDTLLTSPFLDLSEDFSEYSCVNGMPKVAMPIVIDGRHMATFCSEQFFFDTTDPHWQYFLRQAEELGFDTIECMNALKRVPMFSREYIRSNMFFLRNMMNVLVHGGLENITERKRMEELQYDSRNIFYRVNKLETLDIMVGGIAHDLNNILVGIFGHISLAQRNLANPSKANWSLEIAKMESLRATELTRRLTTFAKGDILVQKQISVRNLIYESVALTMQKGNRIKENILISDSLRDILADEGQIIRVFSNIVINAMQAMPRGGTLTILADNVGEDECRTLGLAHGTHIKISFTDEGCGISEADQKKIFDPFFTTKTTGTGLGLTSCRSIVSKHGGRIIVSSVIGTGSTFTIYLPSLENSAVQDGLHCGKSSVQALSSSDDSTNK